MQNFAILSLFIFHAKKPMHHFYSLLLLLLCFEAASQENHYTSKLATVTIVSPGISYEHPLANKLTIKGKAAFTVDWSFSTSSSLGQSYSLAPTGLVAGQLRYYYNFALREQKEKKIARNSANYISFVAKYKYSGITYRYGDSFMESFGGPRNYSIKRASHMPNLGIVWGIQRNYKNRFSIDCSVGPSLYTPFANNEFTLIGDVSIGLWLGKKSK